MVITSIIDLCGQNANIAEIPNETREILNTVRCADVKNESFL